MSETATPGTELVVAVPQPQATASSSPQATPGLFDRALRRITNVWRDMASSVSSSEDDGVEAQIRACLSGRGGEVSARNRAAKLAETYASLDQGGRRAFLRTVSDFDSDAKAIAAAYAKLQAARDEAESAAAKSSLRRALEPPRVRLLTQFTTIPDGMKFIVELRTTLLGFMQGDPHLQALEADMRTLLANWFDVGFLELKRIDWASPAALLEKLVGYEAVHEIRSWRDLKNRLDSDRRCYAFFHPRMPDEPLIFVEVALVKGLASSVQRLLDQKAPVQNPKEADAAIFYSISNCQRGLAGISFGNFLIKRVVSELSAEFANIKTFATLSPIPGFRRWLDRQIREDDTTLLTEDETKALLALEPAETGGAALTLLLARRNWVRNPLVAKPLEPILVRLCARYLLAESNGKRAADPVAHFHLSNGARIERINACADTSEKGIKESAALMVNYLYAPDKIESNHEDYAGEGKRQASTFVRKLARGRT
jgi:malonyl-CoA decarboxylase